MNILHITTFLQGGAGRIICDLAIEQKKLGHNVYVVTSKTQESDYCNYAEYINRLNNADVILYEIDSTFKRDLYLNLKVVEKVKEIIINSDIDLIHAHAAIPALVGLISRQASHKYIPVIHSMQGWGTNKTPEQEETDKIIMNGLDAIIASSQSSFDLMCDKGINKEKIGLIYNGIACTDISESDKVDDDVREMIKLKHEGVKTIGCIGTICKRKNQGLLLEAFKEVVKAEDAICVFVGEGELVHELMQKANEYGIADRVRFWGYKENSYQFYKYFYCVVLPSLSEGHPITTVECFREKVLFIGSDIPSITELIKHGETGFLFKSNNPASLAGVIKQVLSLTDDESAVIAEKAYDFYSSSFTLNAMLDNYMRLYEALILKGKGLHK
ncbi:MAG TPA: glycosyltransferase family 4 protein [Bacillota bacterium]|nr:glycosyltransferase family 4 protein [Bacillota bacterium]HPX68277.1 glycosyltransferase family 4 protein [Bacillota bacterium]HQA65264.1 glycosyltransferase family 4 protein [Bacillota bacterium]